MDFTNELETEVSISIKKELGCPKILTDDDPLADSHGSWKTTGISPKISEQAKLFEFGALKKEDFLPKEEKDDVYILPCGNPVINSTDTIAILNEDDKNDADDNNEYIKDDKKNLQCSICSKNYTRLSYYLNHVKVCARRQEVENKGRHKLLVDEKFSILQCPVCSKTYENENLYYIHVDKCSGFTQWRTQQEQQSADDSEVLPDPLKVSTKKAKITATPVVTTAKPCSQFWEICENIPSDINDAATERENQLSSTTKVSISMDNIRQSGPSLKCPYCSKRLLDIESLEAHMSTAHGDELRPSSVSSQDGQVSSEQSEIPETDDVPRYKCLYCSMTYTKGNYMKHRAFCKKRPRKKPKRHTVHDELERITIIK